MSVATSPTPDKQAEQLAKAIRQMLGLNEKNRPADEARKVQKILSILDRLLDQPDESPLLQAMRLLADTGEWDGVAWLQATCDRMASEMNVSIQEDGDTGDLQPGSVLVVLTPCLLEVDGHAAAPDSLSDLNREETTAWLGDAFYRHGLVDPLSSLLVFPKLWSLADLPQTWSGQRSLTSRLIDSMETGTLKIRSTTPVVLPYRRTELRFLLTVVAAEDGKGSLLQEQAYLDSDDDETWDDRFEKQFAPWRTELEREMLRFSQVKDCRVLNPRVQMTAQLAGIEEQLPLNLAEALHYVVPSFPMIPEDLRITIALYEAGGNAEWRVGLECGARQTGICMPIQIDEEIALDILLGHLDSLGLPHAVIRLQTESHTSVCEVLACPECAAPIFPFSDGDRALCAHQIGPLHQLH